MSTRSSTSPRTSRTTSQRPAAPVTTYLLGLAVGAGMPLHEAADKIRDLASGWKPEQ